MSAYISGGWQRGFTTLTGMQQELVVVQKKVMVSMTLHGHVRLCAFSSQHLVRNVPEPLRPCIWVVAAGLIVAVAAAKAASKSAGCQ